MATVISLKLDQMQEGQVGRSSSVQEVLGKRSVYSIKKNLNN